MGEADNMIDGTICSYCGSYFQDPEKDGTCFTHGYPVVCKDCWDEADDEEKHAWEKVGVQVAIVDTL